MHGAEQPAADIDLLHPTGEVALDDWPFCDVFVIRSGDDFSLARWRSGMWFWGEADTIFGQAYRAGLQVLFLAGAVMSGEMTVLIEETGLDLRRAQDTYRARCLSK